MRRLLIISPYFPPTNSADMQRVRMSLPYFKEMGWEAEVVTVDVRYSDTALDPLLLQSVPQDIKVHLVPALKKKYTAKLGLGSLALRSLWFYNKAVTELLRSRHFDLIYFSTTQFPVCVLGARWKKRFHIPYVIDMQDPWHSEYYLDKPRSQRPPKYWFSYRLNKYMEPVAMKHVGGLISVSAPYIAELKLRYPEIQAVPSAVIPFGAFGPDMKIAEDNSEKFGRLLAPKHINFVYVGRGGADMHRALRVILNGLKLFQERRPDLASQVKMYFIGTSYAPAGHGTPTISPVAAELGLQETVVEITDRIGYYHTLLTLKQASALVVPGSDDPSYTASKIYPYLLAGKPLLTVFSERSPANQVLAEYGSKYNYPAEGAGAHEAVAAFMDDVASGKVKEMEYNQAAQVKYGAAHMTRLQCELFRQVIGKQTIK